MVEGTDIRSMGPDELLQLIGRYPWYGGARKLLCVKLAAMGSGSEALYAEAALYLPSRSKVTALAGNGGNDGFADAAISDLIRREVGSRQIVVVGGDYFSQSEYDGVRRSEDGIFSSFATRGSDAPLEEYAADTDSKFCTEALAQIYQEQGYTDKAREIYSKLSLRYPEKSVYFAARIEEIKENQIKQ